MGPYMRCQASLTYDAGSWPLRAISIDQIDLAVRLVVLATLLAITTGVDLCTNSNSLPDLDKGYFWADPNSVAYDL